MPLEIIGQAAFLAIDAAVRDDPTMSEVLLVHVDEKLGWTPREQVLVRTLLEMQLATVQLMVVLTSDSAPSEIDKSATSAAVREMFDSLFTPIIERLPGVTARLVDRH
jgi:hypothetical protein